MSATDIADFEARLAEDDITFDLARDLLDAIKSSRAEVAALRRQMEKRESPNWVTVREKWWTVAQILANAWRRHPLTCSERDKLLTEWDSLRSGEAGKGAK